MGRLNATSLNNLHSKPPARRAGSRGGGGGSDAPEEHIRLLKQNPTLERREQFDAVHGAGAALRLLGEYWGPANTTSTDMSARRRQLQSYYGAAAEPASSSDYSAPAGSSEYSAPALPTYLTAAAPPAPLPSLKGATAYTAPMLPSYAPPTATPPILDPSLLPSPPAQPPPYSVQEPPTAVPDGFLCPITIELMQVLPDGAVSLLNVPVQDPVIASDGHTYERAAIERWLQKSKVPEHKREVGA